MGKLDLEPPPMGAERFLTDPQALAGGRLNLGAWHGYHEVVHRDAVAPKEIAFDFRLGRATYLLLVFEQGARGPRQALRLSNA
ncbi:MAG: hypothetical protein KF813_14655, partial [Trueperaceae bacterium]|nr:hypothetical protein [Trueperaceae bacterium]